MKLINKVALAILSFIFCAQASAEDLAGICNGYVAPLKNGQCSFSIKIISCDTGETVFEANPDLPVPPASNQKLMTTITALSALGPQFEFTTTLACKGDDYYIIGDGDPGFGDPDLMDPVTQAFDDWAIALRKKGITEIKGKLIFDDSVFDREYRHPNWSAKYLNQWYAAPVSGFCMNDNCLDLSIDFDSDRKAQLTIVPGMENLNVEPVWIPAKASQTVISPAWESDETLKVRITLGSRSAGPVNFTVKDPLNFFASVLQNRFRAYGIKVPDEGRIPESSKTFRPVTRRPKNYRAIQGRRFSMRSLGPIVTVRTCSQNASSNGWGIRYRLTAASPNPVRGS